jgi:energy-coupling factor transporter ATP-binding protein EcfA2
VSINLRASDRAIIIGANGTGKSTLAEHLLTEFRHDYPSARIAVLDTKPRWRAERQADGTSTRRLYRHMAKGDTIPGSVSISNLIDWPVVWDHDTNPSQSVIAQRITGSHADNVRFQTAFAERFFSTQTAKRPSLLYLDEGMDFFSSSSTARGGSDIVQRCFRAGRERGLSTMIGVQRPISINLQCLTETNYCALFRINFVNDVKRLHEMGFPIGVQPPTYKQNHSFRLWREGSPDAPLYRLSKSRSQQRKVS